MMKIVLERLASKQKAWQPTVRQLSRTSQNNFDLQQRYQLESKGRANARNPFANTSLFFFTFLNAILTFLPQISASKNGRQPICSLVRESPPRSRTEWMLTGIQAFGR